MEEPESEALNRSVIPALLIPKIPKLFRQAVPVNHFVFVYPDVHHSLSGLGAAGSGIQKSAGNSRPEAIDVKYL